VDVDSETFRNWLAEHGCRFDHKTRRERGEGHGVVTVHHEGRTAILPLLGSNKAIDPVLAHDVCDALGLDWRELPGPKSRL
jgi:hypothetical protein